MAEVASVLVFVAGLMVGVGVIVFTLVDRRDAILSALAGEAIPARAPVTVRKVVTMRPLARRFRPGPTRQQLRRAAA